MKLVYIANARIPTEKAHGIQIMKTCEALVKVGVDLELWLPKRKNPAFAGIDIFEHYGLDVKFSVRYFDCWDMIGKLRFFSGLGFYIESKTFASSIASEIKKGNYDQVIFYSRDTYPVQPLIKKGIPFFYEVHTLPNKPAAATMQVMSQAKGILAISQGLAQVVKKYVKEDKIFVSPDGADLSFFKNLLTKKQARQELGLPQEQKIVLYSGHLYEWKGTRVLAQASGSLEADTYTYFVGGTDTDIKEFKEFIVRSKLDRVRHLGRVAHGEVPKYLAAADVLVLPNSAKFDISKFHTSPLKLFEYMAARRPIVASDIPSLREILDESMAIFFIPDDPLSLAKKIKAVLAGEVPSERLATNAYEKVQKYSWENRVKGMIEFIKSKIVK